ncbi:DUF6894 family protein [Bradyrhizobium sp. RDM12]
MPHCYFHVLDGIALTDDTGTELVDRAEAKVEAVRLAGAMLMEALPSRFFRKQKRGSAG